MKNPFVSTHGNRPVGRGLLRGLLTLLMLAMAGCTPRGALVPTPGVVQGAAPIDILVATNRALSPDGMPTVDRGESLSFLDVGIVLPPDRPVGQLPWPGQLAPDATRHITTDGIARLADADAFVAALRRTLRSRQAGMREVVVFVHGYNTNFAEATARLAQMTADLGIPAVPVLFAWPSQERVLGYVHDRDSVLVSRTDLDDVLRLVRRAGPERVILVAHSMGAQLVAETLVLADTARPGAAAELADSVVMISPDIAVDVFVAQVARIERLPLPFVVFTSDADRALRVSRWVAGNLERLGKPSSDPRLPTLGVSFLDVTEFNDPTLGDFGHLTVGSSPALIALVPKLRDAALALETGSAATPGIVPGALLSVRSASELVLQARPLAQ